jgi:hypothetical protein
MYTLFDSIQPFKPAVRLEQLVSRRALGSMRAFGMAAFLLGGGVAATLHFSPESCVDDYNYSN